MCSLCFVIDHARHTTLEPLGVVTVKVTIFGHVALCSLVDSYQHFGGTC
jgi:hypothetical protein